MQDQHPPISEAPTVGPPPASPDPAAPSSIGVTPGDLPNYQLIAEVGRGGQAVVYEALQASTGQRVALKVLLHQGPLSDSQKARLDREVAVLASIRHPHLVPLIDRGVTASGRAYFVMPHIAGQTLDRWADRIKRDTLQHAGQPDTRPLLRLMVKVCSAVQSAHERGVVHRDLKPANIRVDERGEPYLLDFGIAHLTAMRDLPSPVSPMGGPAPHPLAHDMTDPGQFVGTLRYASPEQAQGISSSIDARTDVYALGVILYRLVTGEMPYELSGSHDQVLRQIRESDPTPLSVIAGRARALPGKAQPPRAAHRVDARLEAILMRCLAKAPADRFADAGELGDALARHLESPLSGARRGAWPGGRVATLAVGAAALLIIAVVLYPPLRGDPGASAPTPSAASAMRPGAWVELTQMIDPAVHAPDGGWDIQPTGDDYEPNRLKQDTAGEAWLTLPVEFEPPYIMEFGFKRENNLPVRLWCPIGGGRRIGVALGLPGESSARLEGVPDDTGDVRTSQALALDQRHNVTIRVEPTDDGRVMVEVKVNDAPVMNWTGRPDSVPLASGPSLTPAHAAMLASADNTGLSVERLGIRPYGRALVPITTIQRDPAETDTP